MLKYHTWFIATAISIGATILDSWIRLNGVSLVDFLGIVIINHVTFFNSSTDLPPKISSLFFRPFRMTLLSTSTYPLVRICHAYEKRCSIFINSSMNHSVSRLTKCYPLSLTKILGTPYLDMMFDIKNFRNWNSIVDARSFAYTHFEK